MLDTPIYLFTIIITTYATWVCGLELGVIPEHLLSCYRNRPPVLPKTMDTLIDIIRKIEMRPDIHMDMRMLSNALLHKFRVDGIERDPNVAQNMPGVVPYRISGFQGYRQQIMFKYLIPDNAVYFPINSTLTETEKCNLHWILSSAVDVWERGDESRSCPQSNIGFIYNPPQRFGTKLSSCPEQQGVIYQEHGTVSPGTVIAAIAAGLAQSSVQLSLLLSSPYNQQQNRPISWQVPSDNTVNNTHVATLAGDLAEVIEFQAVNVRDIYLGPSGKWNDSYVPTAYYFTDLDYNRIEKKAWEISDAEIVGGVDGLILSKQTTLQNSNMRLSQVLEMYYSDRGLLSDANVRACNREINAAYMISNDKQTLLTQVENFASVLAVNVPKFSTDDKFINSATRQTMDKFTPYLSDIMKKSRCIPRVTEAVKMDISIIIDQTWNSYNTLQFIMFLSRAVDVSFYGSRMTVINGQRGSVIVSAAENTTSVFLSWASSFSEVYDLNLPRSLLAIKTAMESAIDRNRSMSRYNSQSYVALIIGYSSTISDEDHNKAKSIITSIKSLNPDMKFVYLTSRVNSYRFVQLTALPNSQTDKIVVVDNISNIQSFTSQLQDPLSLVPRSLAAPYCKGKKMPTESMYEEYVTPGQPVKYRIHPDYLCGSSNLQIKILNWEYGELQVCMSRTEFAGGVAAQCKTFKPNEQQVFTVPRPCDISPKKKQEADLKQQWLDSCLPVFFDISARSSLIRCSENECRYPDQVKFTILLQGLKCVEPYKTVCGSAAIFSPDMTMFVTSLFVIFYYYYK